MIELLFKRISHGSSIKIAGFELGERLKDFDVALPDNKTNTLNPNGDERETERTKIYEETKGIFLTHILMPRKESNDNYNIFIYLIRHNIDNFDDVDYVEFFFGHMWGNRIFSEKQKNGYIGISTYAYNPFLCTCKIIFKDKKIVTVHRYIDFEMINILK
ncbi:MAG: pYEATS domain-containing protein [Ignavibacteria bacterium]